MLTHRQARRQQLNNMRALQGNPNAALVKGETSCNRTDCQKPLHNGERWWNTSTRAWYCIVCARRINETQVICFLEGSVGFVTEFEAR